jgi:predicted RNA binding protein YcfA (HicA-like mRNA interferase family)
MTNMKITLFLLLVLVYPVSLRYIPLSGDANAYDYNNNNISTFYNNLTTVSSDTTKTFGFYIDRQKGSHVSLKNPDGRFAVVPYHTNKPLKEGTMKSIIS